ncbi:hypothetical protein VKT23_019430 [Stygiomarasmius scandens]|uniref:F-box domain-containing protein n=1 Tax=Marasmiellus scandens TaxID=2682957 RepID=A0ABR1ILF0_9AGAR
MHCTQVHHVPSELLKDIFEEYSSGGNIFGSDMMHVDPLNRQSALVQPAFTISAVCKQWRIIALSTPQIWSDLDVYCSSDLSELNKIKLAVDRSGKHPLTITIRGQFEQFFDVEAVVFLVQVSNRWQHLRFFPKGVLVSGTKGYKRLRKALSSITSLPILQSVCTNTVFSSRTVLFPAIKLAPLLHRLSISQAVGIYQLDDFPLHQVTDLSLSARLYSTHTRSFVAETLQCCKHLVNLELCNTNVRLGWQSVNPIRVYLPSLRSLSILQDGRYLIDLLNVLSQDMHFPIVSDLEIIVPLTGFTLPPNLTFQNAIISLIKNTCLPRNLRSLSLDLGGLPSDVLVTILQHITELQHLSLTLPSDGIRDDALYAMCISTSTTQIPILPKLTNLKFGFYHHPQHLVHKNITSFPLLFSMLKGHRNAATLPRSGCVAPLLAAKVVIQLQAQYAPVSPQRILGDDGLSALSLLKQVMNHFEFVLTYYQMGHGEMVVVI